MAVEEQQEQQDYKLALAQDVSVLQSHSNDPLRMLAPRHRVPTSFLQVFSYKAKGSSQKDKAKLQQQILDAIFLNSKFLRFPTKE